MDFKNNQKLISLVAFILIICLAVVIILYLIFFLNKERYNIDIPIFKKTEIRKSLPLPNLPNIPDSSPAPKYQNKLPQLPNLPKK